MKDYKTTIFGALLAAVSAIAIYQQSGGDLANWKQYVIPALLAAFGYLAKDSGNGLKALALLLLPLCLCQCVSDTSTDKELSYAKTSLAGAALAYDLAALSYTARATDPKVSAYEKLVAERAFKAAADRLAEERAQVQAIIDRRRAEAIALPLASPPGEGPEVLLGPRTAAK